MNAPTITLDASQRAALDLLLRSPFAVMTGGPGTGKTTTLRALLDELDARRVSYELAAPTGKAARRMREATGRPASTVHRLLDFGPDEVSGELRFRRDRDRPIDAAVVVIDEASMLDAALASSVMDAVRNETALWLVGDADQLPSVGPGRVFADLIASGVVPVARLTTLHRAAQESWVCTQAPEVLAGRVPETKPRRDFLFVERETREAAVDALVSVIFKELPARGIAPLDVQTLIPQRKGPAGIEAVNLRLQELLNPARDSDPEGWKSGEVVLRVRDRVLQTRNDYTLGVANGETGTVIAIHNEPTICEPCNGLGEVAELGGLRCDVCKGKGRRPPALIVKYPDVDPARDRLVRYERGDVYALDLAYALTIHKSQGSQWPWVVVLCHSTHTHMLTRPLLYTAITRASAGVVLVGDKTGLARACKTPGATVRNTALRERLRAALPPAQLEEPAPAPAAPPTTDAPEATAAAADDLGISF